MHHVIFWFKSHYVIVREKAKQIQENKLFTCCFELLDVKHLVSGQIYMITKRRARRIGERSLLRDSTTLVEAR